MADIERGQSWQTPNVGAGPDFPGTAAADVPGPRTKPSKDSKPKFKSFVIIFTTLLSTLGVASFTSWAYLPNHIANILIQCLALVMGVFAIAIWWKFGPLFWSYLGSKCPPCSCLDMDQSPDATDSVKLCCLAISCNGPVVIMIGSVVILWINHSFARATTLTLMLVVVASFVFYINIMAIIQCMKATKSRCLDTEGCPEVEHLKSCLNCTMKLNWERFVVVFCLSMMFNVGVTIIGIVTLGTLEEIWESGLAFVPIGLLLFVVPFLATSIALNCIVMFGCLGGCMRCSRGACPGQQGRTESGVDLENMETRSTVNEMENVSNAAQIMPPETILTTLR